MAILKSVFHKVGYELFIFIVLFMDLMSKVAMPNEQIDAFFTPPYLLSYRDGFGSRFFIGSVVSLFTDYASRKFLRIFITAALLLTCVMMAVMAGRVIRAASEKTRAFVIGVSIIFFVSPAYGYLFPNYNFGRLDTFLILFTLIMLAVASKPVLRWTIPVLCLCATATHQVFLCTYAPLVMLVLLYEAVRSKTRSSVALLLVSGAVTLAAFLCFQFIKGGTAFASAQAMADALALRTNAEISVGMIQWEYFSSFRELVLGGIGIDYTLLIENAVMLVLLSPLFVMFPVFWHRCWKSGTDGRWIFVLSALLPICTLPTFVLCDWGRWTAAILISQFCMVYWFIYRQDSAATAAAERVVCMVTNMVVQKPAFLLFIACLIAYLTALGKFSYASLRLLDNMREIVMLSLKGS
ncbi:MAG: hypothetical protein LBR38_04325 [Synergistaceae bacterium]|jgi:hypothetical protein|nr:hypothetical protein [Synergistaceae bacterium]